jgi:alkylation response protein AidB-like acyl-CoA dehydrogenase
MDFWTTSDQEALRDGVRALLTGRFDLDGLAAREGTPRPVDPARWQELADTGVFSLRADGLGMREAVIVFEELGRRLVPGPVVTTHLAAGLIEGAANGHAIVGSFEPSPPATVVEHTAQATHLLWFRDDRLVCLDPTSLDWDVFERPLDPLSPTARCITPLDRIDGDTLLSGTAADDLRRDGVALTAALQLGVALAAVDLANEYAKGREQFGRPVGSFQAVKHLLAEMLVKAEVARSAVYAAACALDGAGDGTDAARAVSAAKVMAGEAALFNGKTGIQVHGGMGFTWEVHAQRYWKRAVVLDSSFGTGDHHALAIAGTL